MSGELEVTDVKDIPSIVAGVKDFFHTSKTIDVSFRKEQLQNLQRLMEENKKRILDALKMDLNKSKAEAIVMEYALVYKDLAVILDSLDELAGPQPHPRDLLNTFNSVYLQPEPYGVVLNIAPWNYPFQLVMLPLIGALAAGNCCILKPSEMSVATSNLVKELIPQYLHPGCCAVITGAVDVSKALLQERFDYILYTGSTNVGKIVMKQAAEHITPVTLELGGKSPALVAPDANIDVAARRIVWGKFTNSGQTCIAPDYVLCPADKRDRLIEACKKAIVEYYGENPQQSNDYGRIINTMHFKRLVGLMESSGTIAFGGKSDQSERYISPTLITDVTTEDKLMQEEIFGPLLPFIVADDVDQAIKIINDKEKPLAFYVFTESTATFDYISKKTSSGALVRNDTIVHAAIESFPFGGVGYSGMGAYHGKNTFKTFCHYKPVLSVSSGMEALNSVRYPPYNSKKLKILGWILSPSRKSSIPWKLLAFFMLVAVVAVLVQTCGLPSWVYKFMDK